MTKIVNLTWHPINLENWKTIPSHWEVRLSNTLEVDDFISTNYGEIMIGKSSYDKGKIPPSEDKTLYVVSNIVCEKNRDRKDLVMPRGRVYNKDWVKTCKWFQYNPFYFN